MAVRIRLTRIGKKKQPSYRVVVAHGLRKRDGRILECIGSYDPRRKPVHFAVKTDRVTHWLERGAVPSDTVARLLKASKKTAQVGTAVGTA